MLRPRVSNHDSLSTPIVHFDLRSEFPDKRPLADYSLLRMDRQRKGKLTAFAHFARHPDFSSMQLDELLGEGQTKPCAFALVRIVIAHLAKLFEDPCLIVKRDADAGVADGDFYRAVGLLGVDSNPPSFWSELDGVG